MKKRIKLISLAVAAGMLISATNVSAYTRQYTFHMNTSYAHGKEPNCGYAATKDDNEALPVRSIDFVEFRTKVRRIFAVLNKCSLMRQKQIHRINITSLRCMKNNQNG